MNKLITKYGQYVRREGKYNICKVICQGCGKEIFNNTDEEVGYSITRRGTANFWHPACEDKVWNSRIK